MKKIEKQQQDYSCGSASVATILKHYYGVDVNEADILEKVIKFGEDGTASFLDLKKAVGEMGEFKYLFHHTVQIENRESILVSALGGKVRYDYFANKEWFSHS